MPSSSCQKCGCYVSVVSSFCPSCGTNIEAPRPRPVERIEKPVEFPNLASCPDCGNMCSRTAHFCPSCGRQFIATNQQMQPVGYQVTTPGIYYDMPVPQFYYPPKSRAAFVLLGLFLGCLGIHNFYAGYTGRAIAQLLITLVLGCWGFGFLITFIWALIEVFAVSEDANGTRMC